MAKEKITMDKDDVKKEHKRLVKVLKSPSHKDDKKEAKEQENEMKKYNIDLKDKEPKKHEKKESAKTEKGERQKEMLEKKKTMAHDTEHESSRDHQYLEYESYKRRD